MDSQHDWSRILIVEDHPGQLDTLLELVREEGYVAVGCSTADEARTYAEREVFGVAVLDLQLPDATGIQLLGVLKQKNPNIRAIINTAFATLDSAKAAWTSTVRLQPRFQTSKSSNVRISFICFLLCFYR